MPHMAAEHPSSAPQFYLANRRLTTELRRDPTTRGTVAFHHGMLRGVTPGSFLLANRRQVRYALSTYEVTRDREARALRCQGVGRRRAAVHGLTTGPQPAASSCLEGCASGRLARPSWVQTHRWPATLKVRRCGPHRTTGPFTAGPTCVAHTPCAPWMRPGASQSHARALRGVPGSSALARSSARGTLAMSPRRSLPVSCA